jgi:BASS family bile acid:Na+ symporter
MNIITTVILPLALAFIMFSLGLGLTVKDFTRVAQQPKDFVVGLLSQVIVLPVVAFILVSTFSVSPEIALGVMIIAAAPGGVTSNLLTSFGRGDVALSVSLTAIISLLCVFTIPAIVGYSYVHFFSGTMKNEISVILIAFKMFAMVTLPVLIGLTIRHFAENFAIRFTNVSNKVSTVLFVLVLLGAIYKERINIGAYYIDAGLITFTLNIVMLGIAWWLANIFGSGVRQKIAISIECGLQNGTLAIAVVTLLPKSGQVIIPAATYSLTMFLTALIFIFILRNKYNIAE